MERLTGAGRASVGKPGDGLSGDSSIARILVIRPVHSLGNLVGLTALVTELESIFPSARIDLVAGLGVTRDIFRNYANVGTIHVLPRRLLRHPLQTLGRISNLRKRPYDLVINPGTKSGTGRMLGRLVRSRHHIHLDDWNPHGTKEQPQKHFAKQKVWQLRQLLNVPSSRLGEAVPPLDLRLAAAELDRGENLLLDSMDGGVKPNKGVIALSTGATGDKCLGSDWWQDFVTGLQPVFADSEIIEILPHDRKSRLAYRFPTFHSLDVREVAAVIGAADLFIGADSGLMHLGSAANLRTVGLFSITDPEEWGVYGGDRANVVVDECTGREVALGIASTYSSLNTTARAPASGNTSDRAEAAGKAIE